MNELEVMRAGGQITAAALHQTLARAKPQVTLEALDAFAESVILNSGGKPSFKSVKNYFWATCLNLNDGVVHGVPKEEEIQSGDVLSVDLGTLYKGFHTDAAWTVIVNDQTGGQPARHGVSLTKAEAFLEVGKTALLAAIDQARVGNHVGHLSQVIEQTVRSAGYSIVRRLVGHGVGRKLHESPQVPGFLNRPVQATPPLVAGMTLAIEVIYAMGSGEIKVEADDGWTVRTADGSLGAIFEHTIAVLPGGPKILSQT